MTEPLEFWIDRGGTFTDCIVRAPDGRLHATKVLSSDRAPVEGILRLLERIGQGAPGGAVPPVSVRLGTTVATNALLERRGMPTVLVTSRGLGDVFRIGTQARPELFELCIRRPPALHRSTVEVDARVGARGERVGMLDPAAVRRVLAAGREPGRVSVAVVLPHAYRFPDDEERIASLARELGFAYVVRSSEIAAEQGLLARGETALADAYLTPLLRGHVKALERELPGSRIRCMQSSGGLTDASRFRGPYALLSGPAGGVVGAAAVATAAGHRNAIGFDMGGTSTDVSLIREGEVERAFEVEVGGVRVKVPMLRIHTVAAGGGSLCRFDGFRLTVGPESAGADPGPLCYGRARAEGARGLTLTDVNLHLGRITGDFFPFPLRAEPVEEALAALEEELAAAGHRRSRDEIAAGFVEIANAHMAQAIATVSVGRGVDPRDHVLVGFGGAAGQHVCDVARRLGIRTILMHPLAGVLSALGIGLAEIQADRQRDGGRLLLPADGQPLHPDHRKAFRELEREVREALRAEGVPEPAGRIERWLDLRYRGTDTAIPVREPADGRYRAAFDEAHRARFGYLRPGGEVEVTALRVRGRGREGRVPPLAEAVLDPGPEIPPRRERIHFPGAGRLEAPVVSRASLTPGDELAGPALVLDPNGALLVEPGFRARVRRGGVVELRDESPARALPPADPGRADPVRLEVFGSRFMGIAEQMGEVLRNTAFSTNIVERLDYSCAVFDGEGGLVANAPHIPVHLGAMGDTVRAVMKRFPDLAPGDAVVTNDPYEGGSHLPDVTVVSPVFRGGSRPRFFVASRGHHADIGGRSPGSMPPDSTHLAEEGVVLEAFRVVRSGEFLEDDLLRRLGAGPWPARRPRDNRADLEAMLAANRTGEKLLQELVDEVGLAAVEASMAQLQDAAAGKVAREIARLPDGEHRFRDRLDDGTPLEVTLRIAGGSMEIDFGGTGPASAGNLNAPPAVVRAAVLYVLRCLVAERIPLNGGCLRPVVLRIPPGSILDPPRGAAVAGGNVETSQRVVDVLLGALGLAAASQGTMNNVTFGDGSFGYYETLGGGAGAMRGCPGASGVHTHMTNTRCTDLEVLESRHPVRLLEFRLRAGSGGAGCWPGGDGLLRRYEFLAPLEVGLLAERRLTAPFGLAGGGPGQPGRHRLHRADGREEVLPGRARVEVWPGDVLTVETPGGGGFGPPAEAADAPGGLASGRPEATKRPGA